MQKSLILMAAILASWLITSCGNIAKMIDPKDQETYAQLQNDYSRVEQEVAAAKEAGDATLVAQKQDELKKLDDQITDIEERAIRNRYGPIWGVLAMVPVIGPYMQWLGPFAGSLLLPILSPRGRRRYKEAFKALAPWVPDTEGRYGIAFGTFILEVLKAVGLLHSTPESAAAANRA